MQKPKNVAIFGATSAVAQDVARLYARDGARLALVGRNPGKLRALGDELPEQVVFLHVQDFADTDAAEACVDAVARDAEGRTLSSVREFAPGEEFRLLLQDGIIDATTLRAHPEPE